MVTFNPWPWPIDCVGSWELGVASWELVWKLIGCWSMLDLINGGKKSGAQCTPLDTFGVYWFWLTTGREDKFHIICPPSVITQSERPLSMAGEMAGSRGR